MATRGGGCVAGLVVWVQAVLCPRAQMHHYAACALTDFWNEPACGLGCQANGMHTSGLAHQHMAAKHSRVLVCLHVSRLCRYRVCAGAAAAAAAERQCILEELTALPPVHDLELSEHSTGPTNCRSSTFEARLLLRLHWYHTAQCTVVKK